jgi:hypothetical protein
MTIVSPDMAFRYANYLKSGILGLTFTDLT